MKKFMYANHYNIDPIASPYLIQLESFTAKLHMASLCRLATRPCKITATLNRTAPLGNHQYLLAIGIVNR